MTVAGRSWVAVIIYPFAIALGLAVARFDVAAPFGDDTAKGTLLLWAACCGALGFLQPRRPWRWAVLVGPWVPAAHLAIHGLGLPASLNPDTYATVLLLVPLSLAVCLAAAYAGSLTRRSCQSP